jgi:DNA-binding GntR family transcriptional regulator
MPVRAALSRLEAEGLVCQLPRRRGAIVAPLQLEDIEEIQAIRSGIEAFAALLGAENIGVEGVARMGELLAQLKDMAAEESLDAYLALEWDLHAACYSAAGRTSLVRLVEDYRRRAERYIRMAVESSPGFGRSVVFQERLLKACERRDGPAAERITREALAWTVAEVREHFTN